MPTTGVGAMATAGSDAIGVEGAGGIVPTTGVGPTATASAGSGAIVVEGAGGKSENGASAVKMV